MAKDEIVQTISPEVVGVVLIQLGWCQGSLLEAASAPKPWLALSDQQNTDLEKTGSFNWILNQEALDANDLLIVASQTCDLQRSPIQEPYIEVIRGYWSSDKDVMHQAGKNSSRLFLMQRCSSNN